METMLLINKEDKEDKEDEEKTREAYPETEGEKKG